MSSRTVTQMNRSCGCSRARWSSASAANSGSAARATSWFTEHEAWFHEDTEVIDFFAPPRDDFLLGGKPALHQPRLNSNQERASVGKSAALAVMTDLLLERPTCWTEAPMLSSTMLRAPVRL